jgi:hypothetical protein
MNKETDQMSDHKDGIEAPQVSDQEWELACRRVREQYPPARGKVMADVVATVAWLSSAIR